ncbi:MAG TPA: CBS domain-containing protein, partial [Chthoniobacterales bacterium]|nr:CBS domain-containing protein [Chthoniobacterales bacterium]
IPPRDLRSWQNLPVSAIANFNPVTINDVSEAALKTVLEKHPYRHFPVIENGELKGIAPRREIETAVLEKRSLRLEPVQKCTPNESIRASQRALIDSSTNTLAIIRSEDGKLLAFLTLHDLLRAQVSMSERQH